jgi:hypothetical protein
MAPLNTPGWRLTQSLRLSSHDDHDHDQVDTEHSEQRDEHAAILPRPAQGRTTHPG